MNTSLYERTPRVTGVPGAAEPAVESSVSAVSWAAILAGAFVAAAASVVLGALGSGLGIAAVAPWSGAAPSTFVISSGIWLIIVQWLASGMGGYVTGRLRTKWVGTHTHEVFFRDTAHGFITWSVATVMVAVAAALAGMAAAVANTHGVGVPADPADAAPDVAHKAAAAASIFTALSMVIGAFIACVAAALGGRQRDEHP